jgi:hypothetical protein
MYLVVATAVVRMAAAVFIVGLGFRGNDAMQCFSGLQGQKNAESAEQSVPIRGHNAVHRCVVPTIFP